MFNSFPRSFLDYYCTGYQNPGNSGKGYFIAFILGTGLVPVSLSHTGSDLLDQTNAFDSAEADFTSVGQTNMITVSSFCGPLGLICGLDVARAVNQAVPQIVLTDYAGGRVPVYLADGLIAATHELFGSVTEPRFPLLPWTHLPCANKHFIKRWPAIIYCSFALGVPKNRRRHAAVLMEDNGLIKAPITKQTIFDHLANGVLAVGRNQKVNYSQIYVGYKELVVPKSHYGCALTAIPYFALAKKACFSNLKSLTLEQWKEKTAHDLPAS